jgi:hypothetical protein
MTFSKSFLKTLVILTAGALLTGCIVRRTVTEGDRTVESGYVLKRPIKEALERRE